MSSTMNPVLARLLAKAAERKAASSPATINFQKTVLMEGIEQAHSASLLQDSSLGISFNSKQSEFIRTVSEGKSCVLIGAAGTGKTTCTKGALNALIQSGLVRPYVNDGHKHLKNATHGVIICAYTRRAVANIKKGLSYDLQGSCLTVHAALEYAPEYYDVIDPITLESKSTMRFSPMRTKNNPIDESVRYCIIEESSMLGVDLFNQLRDALHPSTVFIFLGDIQQLPPVFGSAILGFKMIELPVIELTEVYRQALDSPIISLAHRILSGNEMPLSELNEWTLANSEKGLQFHPIKKKTHPEHILPKIAAFFKSEILKGNLDFETDTILIPFNKGLGTIELNKEIAQFLTERRNGDTYEIIAGFNKLFFSPGDKVLYEKEDAIITSINLNGLYIGNKIPRKHSQTLDRWGFDKGEVANSDIESDDFSINMSMDQIDSMLSGLSNEEEAKERKAEASHCITIQMCADGEEITLSKSSEINALLLGYCLTVHKSQGSEFNKVYLLFHQSHNTMICKEMLYTAITRAKKELYIICESDTFVKGITRQKVPGITIEEKAQHFKGKLERGEY